MSTTISRVKDPALVERSQEIYQTVKKYGVYAGGGIIFAASLLVAYSLLEKNTFDVELWRPVWLALNVAVIATATAALINFTDNSFIRRSWCLSVTAFALSLFLLSPWGQSLRDWWKSESPKAVSISRIEKALPADGSLVVFQIDSRPWEQGLTGKERGCVAYRGFNSSGEVKSRGILCDDGEKPERNWVFDGDRPGTSFISEKPELTGVKFEVASMSKKELLWFAKLK